MRLKKIYIILYLSVTSTFSFSAITLHSELFDYLDESETTSFLLSQKGDVIINKEFKLKKTLNPMNKMFFNLFRHGSIDTRSQEDVASIQKSVVSILIGIAQKRGLLNLDDSVTKYIGKWTELEDAKENPITIKNLLTMTSGLDVDFNFQFKPGSEWKYNSRAYSQLISVLELSSGLDINTLSSQWLFAPLEMNNTFWKQRAKGPLGFRKDSSKYGLVTTAEDLLKFGQFILKAKKNRTSNILTDEKFFEESFTKSQNKNEAYGYLWWLNNSTSHMTWDKGLSSGRLLPNAPDETILALGAGSRVLAIVPSEELILVRLGSFPEDPNFINNLWEYIQN